MSLGGPECVSVIVSREAVLVGGPLWVEPSSSIAASRTAGIGAEPPIAARIRNAPIPPAWDSPPISVEGLKATPKQPFVGHGDPADRDSIRSFPGPPSPAA